MSGSGEAADRMSARESGMGCIRRLMGGLMLTLWTMGAAWGQGIELKLLKRIPIQDLKPMPEPMLKGPGGGSMTSDFVKYGFIRGGKAVYLGHQGWAYDLEKDEVFRLLSDAFVGGITADGQEMLIETRNGEVFWQDGGGRRTAAPRWALTSGRVYLHPGGEAMLSECEFVEKRVHGGPGPELEAMTLFSKDGSASMKIPVNVPKDRRTWIDDLVGFTGDGKQIIAVPYAYSDRKASFVFIHLQTKRFIPVDVMGDVFNRDASLVAGGYENRGETFVWNRKSNSYLWEKKPKVDSVQVSPRGYEDRVVSWGWGIPSAFSPNDRFLLCEGVIVRADTGELAFDGLKGKRGKFSPDGHSLVTVDDEAFYVYTLPKESEPIFGVFQKPEPWSPGKVPARKPKGKAKTK